MAIRTPAMRNLATYEDSRVARRMNLRNPDDLDDYLAPESLYKLRSISGKKKWHHDALLVSLEASLKGMSFGHPRHPTQTCVFSVSLRCLPGVSRVS